ANDFGLNPCPASAATTASVSGSASPTTQNSQPAGSGMRVRGVPRSRSTACRMLRSTRSVPIAGRPAAAGSARVDGWQTGSDPRCLGDADAPAVGVWMPETCSVSGAAWANDGNPTELTGGVTASTGRIGIFAVAGPAIVAFPARKYATSYRVLRLP